MLKVEEIALMKDAQAAAQKRDEIQAEIAKLAESYKPAVVARKAATDVVGKLERQLERGDVGIAGRLTEARAEVRHQERVMDGLDGQLAKLQSDRDANNLTVDSVAARVKVAEAEVRAEMLRSVNEQLEPLAVKLGNVVTYGLAVLNSFGGGAYRNALLEIQVPRADRSGLPFLGNGQLRSPSTDDKVTYLEKEWREDPKLVAMSEHLASLCRTANMMALCAKEIAAEREALLRDDPVAWAAHQEEQRKRSAAKEQDRVRAVAEARAKSEEEEEERQAVFAEKIRSGEIVQHGVVRTPNSPAPGQTQQQFDDQQDARRREDAERRERVAAEAARAEAALNARAADVDEPAAA